MAQEILVNEQIEPGLEFIRMFDQRMPVKVAFWMKEPDRDRPLPIRCVRCHYGSVEARCLRCGDRGRAKGGRVRD